MGSTRNAHSPRCTNVVYDLFQIQIAIENLDSAIAAIAHIYIPLCVRRDGMRGIKLEGCRSEATDRLDKFAVLVVLYDPRIPVPVRNKNVAGRIPGDVCGTIEYVRLSGRWWRARRRCGVSPAGPGFGFSPQSHCYTSLRVKLDNHVRAFIHNPDVVLGIRADDMSHLKGIQPFSNLTQIFSGLIEFKEPSTTAARVDENVPFGI